MFLLETVAKHLSFVREPNADNPTFIF